MVGIAGTITTVAAAMLDLPAYDRDAIDGAVLGAGRDAASSSALLAMTVAERRALPSMHPGRADVIGAGALIWSRVLRRAGVDDATASPSPTSSTASPGRWSSRDDGAACCRTR